MALDITIRFPSLFGDIEEEIRSGGLGIDSYGASMTTLEEVFLQLGEQEEDGSALSSPADQQNNMLGTSSPSAVRIMKSPICKTMFSYDNKC
jgi:hypothetical protein